MGYRYFSTHAPEAVSYPFGYGLGYTTFEWTDAAVRRSGTDYAVTLRVTNTGSRAGRRRSLNFMLQPRRRCRSPCAN